MNGRQERVVGYDIYPEELLQLKLALPNGGGSWEMKIGAQGNIRRKNLSRENGDSMNETTTL